VVLVSRSLPLFPHPHLLCLVRPNRKLFALACHRVRDLDEQPFVVLEAMPLESPRVVERHLLFGWGHDRNGYSVTCCSVLCACGAVPHTSNTMPSRFTVYTSLS